MILELTKQEFEQIVCDIECAIEELKDLSKQVDWYCTDLDERLATVITFIERAK